MTIAPDMTHDTSIALRPDDHGMAHEASLERDFACLVCVTHLNDSDGRRLRLVPGVTGVIDTDTTADLHMIVGADGPRAARRVCVELISERFPHAVVTVPEVVDYNCALLSYLERHGQHPDDVDETEYASFDDARAVAELLDRP